MVLLVSAHIIHMILEIDFYLYCHKCLYSQDFKSLVDVSTEDLKRVREML
jgi:hypothetical protein